MIDAITWWHAYRDPQPLHPRTVAYLDPVTVPGLYRACGCDIDPIVFGHQCQEDEEAA